jgi:uncharacterized membrane protein
MGLTLVVSTLLVVSDHPVAANTVSALMLVAGMIGLYLALHFSARRLAPEAGRRPSELAVAAVESGEPRGAMLAKLALAVCLIAGVLTVGYASMRYHAMPEVVPTHFGADGRPDAWSNKSFSSVMLTPTLNLIISPFLALIALLTAHAKRSVRGGSGGRSIEAQEAFRAAVARLMVGASLFTCALLTLISVQSIRVALGETGSLGAQVWIVSAGTMLFVVGGLIRIIAKYGQGGARLEHASQNAPLTNGLADNARWVWGLFYVNRSDPSILVEKRFGVGYTFNFGNPIAVMILVGLLVLVLGVTLVGILGA